MKRNLAIVVTAVLLVALGFVAVQGATKSKEVTLTGTMSCTSCNLPAASSSTKECCKACITAGDPVMFTDAKGNLYILLNNDKEKPLMNAERMEMVREKVIVTGKMVKRGGIQAIYVKTIEKA